LLKENQTDRRRVNGWRRRKEERPGLRGIAADGPFVFNVEGGADYFFVAS
jgi:hypothetical protein